MNVFLHSGWRPSETALVTKAVHYAAESLVDKGEIYLLAFNDSKTITLYVDQHISLAEINAVMSQRYYETVFGFVSRTDNRMVVRVLQTDSQP